MKYVIIFLFIWDCNIDKEFKKSTETFDTYTCHKNRFFIEKICSFEEEVLDRVDSYNKLPDLSSLTNESLSVFMQLTGSIDAAAALFYLRTIQKKENSQFILGVQQLESKKVSLRENILFLVIPGMFYKDNPGVGANGEYLRNIATSTGIEEGLVPVKQDGTVQENGRYICNFLKKQNQKIIIGSISKGTGDMKRAVSICGEKDFFKRNVKAWINFGGIYFGTLLVNEVEKNWIQYLELRYYFWINNYNYDGFYSLRKGSNSPLSIDVVFPKNFIIINVIGVPMENMVTERALPMYQLLSKFGPNEGMNLLSDSYIPEGLTYPLWRNDHYFRFPPESKKMKAIFSYILDRI